MPSTDRPLENRVSKELYEDFIHKVWAEDYQNISHPRMRFILPQYRWGVRNPDAVKKDYAIVKANLANWLIAAQNKIPWGTVAAQVQPKPHFIVFLFDPGGSFPWVTDEAGGRYIFIDILQLRGMTDDERSEEIDTEAFGGMLVHELFHLFQHDSNTAQDAASIFARFAVGEGSAMLIGNNAPNSQGQKFYPAEPIHLKGKLLAEWTQRAKDTPERIQDMLRLFRAWQKKPPSEAQLQKVMTDESWVASSSNNLLMGDLYRVGAEMLFTIREKLGDDEFYRVVADSSLLVDTWKRATARP